MRPVADRRSAASGRGYRVTPAARSGRHGLTSARSGQSSRGGHHAMVIVRTQWFAGSSTRGSRLNASGGPDCGSTQVACGGLVVDDPVVAVGRHRDRQVGVVQLDRFGVDEAVVPRAGGGDDQLAGRDPLVVADVHRHRSKRQRLGLARTTGATRSRPASAVAGDHPEHARGSGVGDPDVLPARPPRSQARSQLIDISPSATASTVHRCR